MKKSITLAVLVLAVCTVLTFSQHVPVIIPHFNDEIFTLYDNGDVTKRVAFEVSGVSTGTTRMITMPDADVDLGSPTFGTLTLTDDLKLTTTKGIGWWYGGDKVSYFQTHDNAKDIDIYAGEDVSAVARRNFDITAGGDFELQVAGELALEAPKIQLRADGVCSCFIEVTETDNQFQIRFMGPYHDGLIVADSGTIDHDNDHIKTTGNLTDGTNSLSIAEAKTAYTHSQDNTQAHSDYLLNNEDDWTTGTLYAAGFVTAGTGNFQTLIADEIQISGNVISAFHGNIEMGDVVDMQGYDILDVGSLDVEYLIITTPLQDYKFSYRSSLLTLQAQTSGQPSRLEIFSKDGDATDDAAIQLFAYGIPTDLSPYSMMSIGFSSVLNEYRIAVRPDTPGAAGEYPLKLYVQGNTDQLVLEADGDIVMATLPTGTGTDLEIDGSNRIVRNTSTMRDKENIRPLTDGCELYDLLPRIYDRKDSEIDNQFGFIAEEVNEVDPNLINLEYEPVFKEFYAPDAAGDNVLQKKIVGYRKTGRVESVRWKPILALAVAEMQKLRMEVDELQARVTELEKQK